MDLSSHIHLTFTRAHETSFSDWSWSALLYLTPGVEQGKEEDVQELDLQEAA